MKLPLATLLAVYSLGAQNVTFTVATPKGLIEVQPLKYSQISLEGVVTNKTSITLGKEARLVPVYRLKNGSRQKGLSDIQFFGLAPGASQKFWIVALMPSLGDWTSLEWALEGSAEAAIDYRFKEPAIVKQLGTVKATAKVDRTCIAVEVENNSEAPVEIIWDDSSIIGLTRKASRVFHVGIRYSEREKSQPNTVIPPLARIEDEVTPSENAYFIEGGGWAVHPLLPDAFPMKGLDDLAAALPGGKVGLFLQLLISGKKLPLTFVFEVDKVVSGNEVWPRTVPAAEPRGPFSDARAGSKKSGRAAVGMDPAAP